MPDISWANAYVGIPFAEKGMDRRGCNCWGLYRLALHDQTALLLPTYEDAYESTLDTYRIADAMERAQAAEWREVPDGEQRMYDAVKIRMKGEEIHVGMVLDHDKMLHVVKGANATIESYRSLRWKFKVLGFYRHGN